MSELAGMTKKLSFRDENVEDPIDAWEIFDLIRDINDPEHPYTLEQLNVVQEELIQVHNEPKETYVEVVYFFLLKTQSSRAAGMNLYNDFFYPFETALI